MKSRRFMERQRSWTYTKYSRSSVECVATTSSARCPNRVKSRPRGGLSWCPDHLRKRSS